MDESLNDQYRAVFDAMDNLREALKQEKTSKVVALWDIPLRGHTEVDELIPVQALAGPIAWTEAALALTEYALRPGQHPHESLRRPGMIGVSRATLALANEANREKEKLTQALSGYTEAQRTRLHRQFKSLSAKQLLRRLEIVDKPEKLSFLWYGGVSVKRFTAGALRRRLLADLQEWTGEPGLTLRNLPAYPEETEAYRMVKALQDMARVPDGEVIAEKRPTQPHVRCYVRANNKAYYSQVAIPMLYDVSERAPVVDVPLCAFQRGRPALKPKQTRFEAVPLIQYREVYRYLPEYREQEEVESVDMRYQRKRSREL